MLIEMLAAAAVVSGAGQEFAPQIPGAPERVAPRGDYRDSCSGEYVNRGRLYADCRNNRGNIRGTSIELNRCADYEIRNNDGLLVCGPNRGEYEDRPPPAVPAAREFVVYFDWDRSDLTAEASSVVTQAANYAKSGRPTRILVVGHADTSGSAAYNVGLSNRRSRTVADALVAQGVNGGVISLDGKGETALARATADGVREPLNRRATIGINFR
jgi:outer membrane protein OmpA-like peptidoglycan-associated protein